MELIIRFSILNNDIKNRISFKKPIQLQLSIIIVNFNVKYFLEQCLCSVIKAIKNIEAEIIVVDNNSSDGSKEFFLGRFEKVTFIWSFENEGFSKANNKALQQVTGEYVLFLNPDTILPEDCLDKCLSFFQLQDSAGALGVRMIDGSGTYLKESKRGFPSPFTSLCKLSGLTALFPRSAIFATYYMGQLDPYQNHEVDVLAGAFMLIKKWVLDQTGGFDERFFMYGEDIDLSYRIQKAGFKNIYYSETTILHFKGESTKRGSGNYVRLFYGAMILFVKKHYSNGMALFYNLLIQIVIRIKMLLSGISRLATQLFRKKKEISHNEICFIIADKKSYNYIKSILEKNHIHQPFIGRINPPNTTEEGAVGNFEELPLLMAKKSVKELIFSINGYSAKEMLNQLEQLPKGTGYRFHFKDSVSIVGSSDKTTRGDSIA